MNKIETALIPLQVVAQKHKNPGPIEAASTILPELGGNLIFELVEEFWQAGIRNYIFTSEGEEPSSESWEEDRSLTHHYKHQLIKRLRLHYGNELTIIWQNAHSNQSLGDRLLDCQALIGDQSFVLGLATHIVIPEYYNCLRDMISNAENEGGDVVGLNLEWFNHQQQISDTGLGFVSASVGSKYRAHSISFSKIGSCKCWNYGRFIFTPEVFKRIHNSAKGVDCIEDLLLLNQEDTRTVYYCGPSLFFNCSTLDGFLEAEKYFSQLRHGFAAKA